jgi:hypothetical protein
MLSGTTEYDYLKASVNLPQGATITSFSFTCLDNHPTLNCFAALSRDNGVDMSSVATSGASTTPETVTGGVGPSDPNRIVDNTVAGYYVSMYVNRTAVSDIAPIRVVVHYALP